MLQYSKNVLSTLRCASRLPQMPHPSSAFSVGFSSQKVCSQSSTEALQIKRSFHATNPSCSWFKKEERKQYAISTEELKDLVEKDQVFLIDVREAHEVAAGRVPAKRFLHIPVGEFVLSLYLTEQEFEKKYGVPLPKKDSTEVVIMCKRGIRSTFALQLIQDKGFSGVKHYLGGWLEWQKTLSGN